MDWVTSNPSSKMRKPPKIRLHPRKTYIYDNVEILKQKAYGWWFVVGYCTHVEGVFYLCKTKKGLVWRKDANPKEIYFDTRQLAEEAYYKTVEAAQAGEF